MRTTMMIKMKIMTEYDDYEEIMMMLMKMKTKMMLVLKIKMDDEVGYNDSAM